MYPVSYRGRVTNETSVHHNAHYFRAPGTANPGTPRCSEMTAWCEENFGPGTRDMDSLRRWFRTGSTWVIYGDDDALAFRMRWC